jgi:hypothetical protein
LRKVGEASRFASSKNKAGRFTQNSKPKTQNSKLFVP